MSLKYADRDQEPAAGLRNALYEDGRLYFVTGLRQHADGTVTFNMREVVFEGAAANTPPVAGDITFEGTVNA